MRDLLANPRCDHAAANFRAVLQPAHCSIAEAPVNVQDSFHFEASWSAAFQSGRTTPSAWTSKRPTKLSRKRTLLDGPVPRKDGNKAAYKEQL
jgi:hypothetical protein